MGGKHLSLLHRTHWKKLYFTSHAEAMRIAAVTHTIRVCILQTFLTRQRHFIDKRTRIQTGNRKVGRIAPPPDQSHLTANLFAFSANSPRVFVEQMRLRREEDKASDYNFTRQETKITASDFGKGARAAQLSLFPFLLVTKKRKARQNNESPRLGELFRPRGKRNPSITQPSPGILPHVLQYPSSPHSLS